VNEWTAHQDGMPRLRSPRFLIVSEPRSGSNNISYVLGAHPGLEVGNELFHTSNGIKVSDFPELNLAAAANVDAGQGREYHWLAGVTPTQRRAVCQVLFSKYNGFKIHNQHLPSSVIREIAEEFSCSLIVTTRLDIFGQALSNFIAEHAGRWHADDRSHDAAWPLSVRPMRLVNWLNDMTKARTDLWLGLRGSPVPVFVCQYEVFFSGTQTERIGRFLVLLDFLGVTRFGRLPPEAKDIAFRKVLHYVDPAKQKMSSQTSTQDQLTNYEELRARYEVWTMTSSYSCS
jgi:hypothetical protein